MKPKTQTNKKYTKYQPVILFLCVTKLPYGQLVMLQTYLWQKRLWQRWYGENTGHGSGEMG